MQRVRITLGYDGTDFIGSQSQPGGRTVQGELERVLARLAPGSGRTIFAGRTDRGVHAVGQVVSVDVAWRAVPERLRDALNACLPRDIVALDCRAAAPGFHARFDACSREYRYRIVTGPVPPVFERRYVWWRRTALDATLATAACERFTGTRAWGTFAGAGRSMQLPADRLVRTIHACSWRADGGRHELRVVADGFLPHMVRNMVAAIVQVASGARPVGWLDELIAANDRRALGEAAPPAGLVLWRVRYPADTPDDTTGPAGTDEGYEEESHGYQDVPTT